MKSTRILLCSILCFLMHNSSAQDVYSFQLDKKFKYYGEAFIDNFTRDNVRYIVSGEEGSDINFIESFDNQTGEQLHRTEVNFGALSSSFPYYFLDKEYFNICYTVQSNEENRTDVINAQYNREDLELVDKKVVHSFYGLEKKTAPYILASDDNKIFVGALTKNKKGKGEEAILLIDGEKLGAWNLMAETAPYVKKVWAMYFSSEAEFQQDGSLIVKVRNANGTSSLSRINNLIFRSSPGDYSKLEKLGFELNKKRADYFDYSNEFIANIDFSRKSSVKVGTPKHAELIEKDQVKIYEMNLMNNDTSNTIVVNLNDLYTKIKTPDTSKTSLLSGDLDIIDVYKYNDAYYVHLASHDVSYRSAKGTKYTVNINFESHFLKIEDSKIVGSRHIKSVTRKCEFVEGKFVFAVVSTVSKMGDEFRKGNKLPTGHSIVSSQIVDMNNCQLNEWQELSFIIIAGDFNVRPDRSTWTEDPKDMTFYSLDSKSKTLKVGKLKLSHEFSD